MTKQQIEVEAYFNGIFDCLLNKGDICTEQDETTFIYDEVRKYGEHINIPSFWTYLISFSNGEDWTPYLHSIYASVHYGLYIELMGDAVASDETFFDNMNIEDAIALLAQLEFNKTRTEILSDWKRILTENEMWYFNLLK